MPDPTAYYEGDFLITGATPDKDKNNDGTRTAWTAWIVDTGNATESDGGGWSISTDSVV